MPTTAEIDRTATGPNVRQHMALPEPHKRCPRCHRPAGARPWQGDREIFFGLGVPCALCSPIKPHEVLGLVVCGDATLTMQVI